MTANLIPQDQNAIPQDQNGVGAGPRRSPLHARHLALGAKMADFGGWSMPIEYAGGGVLAEHAAVRATVGLFDVSHLGKTDVVGTSLDGQSARQFLDRCLSNDLDRIRPGQAQYTLCCDDRAGGTVDDLIAYLVSDTEVFLVPNAANAGEVARRLTAAAPPGITVRDRHDDFAVLAVQGPLSRLVLERLGLLSGTGAASAAGAASADSADSAGSGGADLAYMAYVDGQFDGWPVRICRTGYTGEHGYELIARWQDASAVWDALAAAVDELGGRPAGLGARDTLRTEMGYPLHGQDLSMSITAVQARAGWAVGWNKPEFWGRAALAAERSAGPRRMLWGVEVIGRGIARAHTAVLDPGGTTVGELTSGTFSPTLKHGIGLALIETSAGLGAQDTVELDVRGRRIAARLVRPPFVASHVR